jgi:bisphosphoglycerate-independent phosphoglycerate mutase (AlkP superfamily)
MKELNSHCMRVINYAIEHVKQVEVDWVEYMQRIYTGVQNEIRSIKQDMNEIDNVYKRYRAINRSIAEREYKIERAKLQRRMNDALDAYRQSDPPRTERTPSLRRSTYELREAFATAYGTVDTAALMTLRQYFEWELSHMQEEILDTFCARCDDLLGT